MVPVIFDIEFRGRKGMFELTDEFTAYPDEHEILLQDGLAYTVLTVQSYLLPPENEVEYYLIKLRHQEKY